jgi:hypothetical protein
VYEDSQLQRFMESNQTERDQKLRKKAAVGCSKILSQLSPGGNDKKRILHQLGYDILTDIWNMYLPDTSIDSYAATPTSLISNSRQHSSLICYSASPPPSLFQVTNNPPSPRLSRALYQQYWSCTHLLCLPVFHLNRETKSALFRNLMQNKYIT